MKRTSAGTAICFLVLALGVAGCGGGGGGGGGASAGSGVGGVVGGSTAGGVGSGQRGPLALKADQMERDLAAEHVPDGLVVDVVHDSQGQDVGHFNLGDSAIWTGIHAAAESMRYRATKSPEALIACEKAARALHDLHAITDEPGLLTRGFAEPKYLPKSRPGKGIYAKYNWIDEGIMSRDQYTGWFYGVGFAWDSIQDPVLRQQLSDDVRAIAQRLMRDDLALITQRNGQTIHHFNLRPDNFGGDRLNPAASSQIQWPLTLFVQGQTMDPLLVAAIKATPKPPLRAGEALRALTIFSVASRITGDPSIEAFYRNELIQRRGYLDAVERYLLLQEDLLEGNNLKTAVQGLRLLGGALADIWQNYVLSQSSPGIAKIATLPLVRAALDGFMAALGRAITYAHNPAKQGQISKALADARAAVALMQLAGLRKQAQGLDQFLTTYGPFINHAGLMMASDSLRSYVGNNLNFLALTSLLHSDGNASNHVRYQGLLQRAWKIVSDESNAFDNLIHAGFGPSAGPRDLVDSLSSLRQFPADRVATYVDNSAAQGLRVSPWPDRFGKVGNIAVDPFPLSKRPFDRFLWQEHPRTIKGGFQPASGSSMVMSGNGFLAAYWLGRWKNLIAASD